MVRAWGAVFELLGKKREMVRAPGAVITLPGAKGGEAVVGKW
jgi:hypothetical protein